MRAMKILAVIGSPRKSGNTYQVTRQVEERMKQLGAVETRRPARWSIYLRPSHTYRIREI